MRENPDLHMDCMLAHFHDNPAQRPITEEEHSTPMDVVVGTPHCTNFHHTKLQLYTLSEVCTSLEL